LGGFVPLALVTNPDAGDFELRGGKAMASLFKISRASVEFHSFFDIQVPAAVAGGRTSLFLIH